MSGHQAPLPSWHSVAACRPDTRHRTGAQLICCMLYVNIVNSTMAMAMPMFLSPLKYVIAFARYLSVTPALPAASNIRNLPITPGLLYYLIVLTPVWCEVWRVVPQVSWSQSPGTCTSTRPSMPRPPSSPCTRRLAPTSRACNKYFQLFTHIFSTQ